MIEKFKKLSFYFYLKNKMEISAEFIDYKYLLCELIEFAL